MKLEWLSSFQNKFKENFIKHKHILLIIFIGYVFPLGIFSYLLAVTILSNTIAILSMNFGIYLISFLILLWLVIESCKSIKEIYKLDNFFMIAVILSIIVPTSGYLFLYSYYSADTSVYQYSYNNENLNVFYNLFNRVRHDISLRGDTICFNMSIKNNNPFAVSVYMKDYVITPTGRSIPENITAIPYSEFANIGPNETMMNDTHCEQFTETGLNTFFPILELDTHSSNSMFYLLPNGIYTYINSESDYQDIVNRRNFSFILALATIPIVLSSIKTFRDLYKKNN